MSSQGGREREVGDRRLVHCHVCCFPMIYVQHQTRSKRHIACEIICCIPNSCDMLMSPLNNHELSAQENAVPTPPDAYESTIPCMDP